MVQELDLTDQDVSTIAAIIDSEIRSYIPDWFPTKMSENNCNFDIVVTSSNNFTSSPQSLSLDQLPSGRKYWSDSPKATGGSSPLLLGPSNLSSEDSSLLLNSLNDEILRNIEDNDTAEVWILAKKLESLLVEQRKELNELKKKHEFSVSDLLKDLPVETLEKVCNICKLKIPENGSCSKIQFSQRNSEDSNSFPQKNLEYSTVGREGGKQKLVARSRIFGSIFRGRINEVNRKGKSGVVIASIL